MLNLPEKLRKWRKESQMSAAEVCEYLEGRYGIKLTTSSIYGYEKGTRTPNPETLFALFELYDAPYTVVFNDIENPKAHTKIVPYYDTGTIEEPEEETEEEVVNRIKKLFEKLSLTGLQVAEERLEELTEIPRYKRKTTKTKKQPPAEKEE